MLCSDCHAHEAQVFLKQIVDSQVLQRALCPDCARRLAQEAGGSPDVLLMQVLAGLEGLLGRPGAAAKKSLQCATCGLRYSQFQETGRLGCADCYESFREPLTELLRRVHGSDQHRGKLPKGSREARRRAHGREELASLERQLKTAIDKERFEEAATLRDEIQKLQH